MYRREHTRTDASDDDYKCQRVRMILRKASRGLVITNLSSLVLNSKELAVKKKKKKSFSRIFFFVSHVGILLLLLRGVRGERDYG